MDRHIIKIILICLLLTAGILTFISSCETRAASVSTDDGQLLMENDMLDFYFYYPEDWAIDKNSSFIVLYKGAEEVLQTNILSKDEPYAVISKPNIIAEAFGLPASDELFTPAKYWDELFYPLFDGIFDNIEIILEEDTEIDGSIAKKYVYTAELAGVGFKYAEVVILRRGSVYKVTYTALPDNFDEYSEVFDDVIASFRFK